ncbi:MAG: hypothetical protein ACYC22_10645 [Thiomonas delicata]
MSTTCSPAGARAPRQIDVCNGDADGLCAVLQWRLDAPADAELITGLKRDIALLERVQACAGDEVLVCDLSMQRNRAALLRLLAAGVRVRYFDHHMVRAVPRHPGLEAHLDFAPDACSSLLVDRHLHGRWRAWALVGAYGDNLRGVADAMAASYGLDPTRRERLRRLGEAINYNAYGEDERDVSIAPARLYPIMARYRDPLDFLDGETIAARLDAERRADLDRARALRPHRDDARAGVWLLPDAAWSRRVIGTFANELAFEQPRRAHAVLRQTASGDFTVSVRAPLDAASGANTLCARFGGTGRATAAGIDRLPQAALGRFLDAFAAMRWGRARR